MAELIVLRLVHVLGGIFWVGAGLFNMVYLGPAMAAAGPAAAGSMMQIDASAPDVRRDADRRGADHPVGAAPDDDRFRRLRPGVLPAPTWARRSGSAARAPSSPSCSASRSRCRCRRSWARVGAQLGAATDEAARASLQSQHGAAPGMDARPRAGGHDPAGARRGRDGDRALHVDAGRAGPDAGLVARAGRPVRRAGAGSRCRTSCRLPAPSSAACARPRDAGCRGRWTGRARCRGRRASS